MVGNHVYSMRLKLDDYYGPFQPKPFCDSMVKIKDLMKFLEKKKRKCADAFDSEKRNTDFSILFKYIFYY